jgi:uncharacterized Tic20 family protein
MAEEHPFPEETPEESSESPPTESEQPQENEAEQEEVPREKETSGEEETSKEEETSEEEPTAEVEVESAAETEEQVEAEQPAEEEMPSEIQAQEEAESAAETEEQVEAEQPAEEEIPSEIQVQEAAEKEAAPPPTAAGQQPLSPSDERTWAMLAHLSVLVNLITGFLGPLAALIIYLVFKDRSRYVAYQSMQSFVFQLVFWVGGGALIGLMWAITGILSAVIIGILCIPFALLGTLVFGALPLVALIYGPIGAIETSQGKDFKYWLIGDWVRDTLTEAF